MAWRFKASKYKNAAPIVPKFEQHIRDLSIGSHRSHGNFIAASAAFMAFNWESQGSSLGVLPLDTKGRQSKTSMPLINAHSDTVTDFQFSPFDDGLLATGSQDSTIKLWKIPEGGLTSNLTNPEMSLQSQARRIETINFHPTADCVLATSAGTNLTIWNLIEGSEMYTFNDHQDEVQSVAWQYNGKLLATQCKDRQLRILDPRGASIAAQTDSHEGIKDSKVVWIGDTDRVFTTGFSGDRLREITIRDIRNIKSPVKNMTLDMSSGILVPLFDPDTNMCFLSGKGDRNIQFIELTDREPFIVEGLKYSGDQTKGACLVPKRAMNVMQGEVNRILQLCDSSIVPIMWQVPRKTYRDYHADIYPETYGLESNMGPGNWFNQKQDITPSMINLDPKLRPKETLVTFPNKPISQRELVKKTSSLNGSSNGNGIVHNATKDDEELFVKPNPRPRFVARSMSTACESSKPIVKPRIPPKSDFSPKPSPRSASLDSNDEDETDEGLAVLRRQPSIRDRKKLFEENIRKSQNDAKDSNTTTPQTMEPLVESPVSPTIESLSKNGRSNSIGDENKENKLISPPTTEESAPKVELRTKKNMFIANDKLSEPAPTQVTKRPTSKMFGRVSKFKHLKGEPLHKSKHFENLKNLSKTVPAECNMVHANSDRIALPLTGPGGKLAIYEIKKSGRIPDGVQPVLINGTTVMDFAWDPFDNSRIIVACDDGYLRLWNIPKEGLTDQVNEPQSSFPAHAEKIQVIKFHPLAKNILLTAAFDRSVKIWNLENMDEAQYVLEGHGDQLYSAEWSQCGRFVATLCKDKKIRIYQPRKSSQPVLEGGEITPKKGARVVWVLNGEYLIVTGFSRQSEQQVTVYKTQDLTKVHDVTLAVSPAVLIPYYDEDSNSLFLTGRGESTVTTFEVAHDAPHLFPLAPYKPSSLHQGFAFLTKNICNVREVEFARAFRLTNTSIEPISFTVPRVKTAFFQDDLFPPTRILWESTLSASEWLKGVQKDAKRLNLKPDDMKALTVVNGSNMSHNRASISAATVAEKSNKQKSEDLEKSISNMLAVDNKLEQDSMEGAEESDWN